MSLPKTLKPIHSPSPQRRSPQYLPCPTLNAQPLVFHSLLPSSRVQTAAAVKEPFSPLSPPSPSPFLVPTLSPSSPTQ
ncbi:uncharacterized protein DS421_5g146320 [Arachis hypogaea]|nr:uncharacterized protein DS421_5g146320 [Arachis hypogaea]